jgi:hypothetical protein
VTRFHRIEEKKEKKENKSQPALLFWPPDERTPAPPFPFPMHFAKSFDRKEVKPPQQSTRKINGKRYDGAK